MAQADATAQRFFALEATDRLPAALRTGLPPILWLPDAGDVASPAAPPVLLGTPLPSNAPPVPLVTLGADGAPRLHFDVAGAIEGTLLERYHPGLEPTLEMRLPFNYARLPGWLKTLALGLRRGAVFAEPELAFPPGQPSFVVEWLRELARWAGHPGDGRGLLRPWPGGRRAAVTVTHDVDTDWIFRHPDALERLCDLEEEHGFRGAWYCVPARSRSRAAQRALEGLAARGCEIGCHGYNHDAKWPLLGGRAFERRLGRVREFARHWAVRGFRSEWYWRTPRFLEVIGNVFEYDSSVPNVYAGFTRATRNGCATCFPYRTHGGLLELPITLPVDEERRREGLDPRRFWSRQLEGAERVIERGGVVVLTLHPQPHQGLDAETLAAFESTLASLGARPDLWIARPDAIVEWVAGRERADAEAGSA